jgi:UPF0755 protein
MLRFFLVLVTAGALATSGFLYSVWQYWNNPLAAGNANSAEVVLEIKPGDSLRTVSEDLKQVGFAIQPFKQKIAVKLFGGSPVRIGEYALRKDMSPKQIAAVLASGKSLSHLITIPEGYNLFEIADILAKEKTISAADFLKVARNSAIVKELTGETAFSLEGYLFPDTYSVTKFTTARELAGLMVAKFKENISKITAWPSGLTRHQFVVLASIVEKETGIGSDRPVVSSVFHNRIKLGMKLQTDPTVIYGIWEKTGVWAGNISRKNLQDVNRYNTYVISGLPVGPIGNPGLQSMLATANPAKTDYLYFVSRNDGTTVFSKDLKSHNASVGKFQLDPKARENKSWRNKADKPKSP